MQVFLTDDYFCIEFNPNWVFNTFSFISEYEKLNKYPYTIHISN